MHCAHLGAVAARIDCIARVLLALSALDACVGNSVRIQRDAFPTCRKRALHAVSRQCVATRAGCGGGGERRRSILATAGALAVAKKAWLAAANGLLAATCALSVVMHSRLIVTSGLMAMATAMVIRAGRWWRKGVWACVAI